MVIVCVQNDLLPQQSCACQVATTVCRHELTALVTTLNSVTLMLVVAQQLSVAAGGVSVHAVPHWKSRLLAQAITGGTLSTTVMVWLQLVLLPQQSVITHVRVTTRGQKLGPLVTVP